VHLLPATPIEKLWWVALLLLLGGYLAGTWLNRKRSKALGFWLQSGLGVLGSKIQWKWIGTMSSGAQVTVRDARKPFRQLEITYLLLTRELAPLWGIELLRGKRDLLILRATCVSSRRPSSRSCRRMASCAIRWTRTRRTSRGSGRDV